MASIFLSGYFSVRHLTIVADNEVLPTPPLPATAIIVDLLISHHRKLLYIFVLKCAIKIVNFLTTFS